MQVLAEVDPQAERKVRAYDLLMKKEALGAGDVKTFREGLRRLFGKQDAEVQTGAEINSRSLSARLFVSACHVPFLAGVALTMYHTAAGIFYRGFACRAYPLTISLAGGESNVVDEEGGDGGGSKRDKGRPMETNHDLLAAYIDTQVRLVNERCSWLSVFLTEECLLPYPPDASANYRGSQLLASCRI